MKKIILFLIGLLSIAGTSRAQWITVAPEIDSEGEYYNVTSTDEVDGMIVVVGTKNDLWRGYKYYVATSIDGGYTWTEGQIDTTYHKSTAPRFRRIKMFSRKVGLAVGDSGMIIRTVDSAQTWEPVDRRRKWQYRDVSFDDQGTAYVTGSHGVFGTSTDDGVTWSLKELVVPSSLNSVIAKKSGLYLGDRFYNRMFRSTNEGNTWDTLTFSKFTATRLPVELLILDDNSYVSIGTTQVSAGVQKPHVIYSSDAVQWNEASIPHFESMYDLTAAEARGNMLVAGGRGAFLYTSTDNGSSWSADSIENTGGIAFMRDISILSDGNVLTSVGGPTSTFLIRSTNSATVTQPTEISRYAGDWVSLKNESGLIKEYQVFDTAGRLITAFTTQDSMVKTSTLSLPSGLYVLRDIGDFKVLFTVAN